MCFSINTWSNTVPIKIILPYAAGGPFDRLARVLQTTLSDELRQPVVIEYKPGAGASLGVVAVASADPRETVLLLTGAPVVLNLFKEPAPYKSSQLVPVAYLGKIPFVLVSSTKFGVNSIGAWKKIDSTLPISVGSVGIGSATQMIAESFNQKVSKKMVMIPYKGQAPLLTDLLGNNLDSSFLFSSTAVEYIQAHKLVAVAVDSKRRLPELPDVPTFKESGIDDLGDFSWAILLSNRTENTQTLKRIQKAMFTILNDPSQLEKFRQAGLELSSNEIVPPADFLEREKKKLSRYSNLITE